MSVNLDKGSMLAQCEAGYLYFDSIPDDNVLEIFKETEGKNFKYLSLVDKRFHLLMANPSLSNLWNKCFRIYSPQEVANIENNLNQSNFVCSTFPNSKDLVSFHIKDRLLARTFSNGSIEVLCLDQRRAKRFIPPGGRGYSGGFGDPCVKFVGPDKLFLGSYNGCVTTIDLEAGGKTRETLIRPKYRLKPHDKPICLQVVNEKLFSGSCGNKRVDMRDPNGMGAIKTIGEYGSLDKQENFCLQANNQHVFFTANGSGLIEKWNIESEKLAGGFEHGAQVTCLQLTENYLISGGHLNKDNNEVVKIWDINSGKCLKVFPFDYGVTSIFATDRRVFAGGVNGHIVMFDIKSGERILIADCRERINQMQFVDGKLVVNGKFVLEFNISQQESDDINFEKMKRDTSRANKFDFQMLPAKHKNKIYEALYLIKTPEYFNSRGKNYDSCSEDAFWARNGLSATHDEARSAILNFLALMNYRG